MNKSCNCPYVYNYDVNIEVLMKLWLYYLYDNLHHYFCNLKKIFHHLKEQWKQERYGNTLLALYMKPKYGNTLHVLYTAKKNS